MSETPDNDDDLAISGKHLDALAALIDKLHCSHSFLDRNPGVVCPRCDELMDAGVALLEDVANEARAGISELAAAVADQIVDDTMRRADMFRLQGERRAVEEAIARLISEYGYASAVASKFYRDLDVQLKRILKLMSE